ncbi:MAG: L,D-transpeptidase family protein [Chloroflexi bacterium]|nr:L,D-transpeptidase family protein [Chloroflexota bacterium]
MTIAFLCVGVSGIVFASGAFSQRYAGQIYPGVNVYGVDLGGQTVNEAADTLSSKFPDPTALPLTLRDGERIWNRSWADIGIRPDLLATARLAYQVGREGTAIQQHIAQLQAFSTGWPIPPILVLPNPAQATEALRALNTEMAVPPVNANLIIQPDGITPVPGQMGQELDIEAIVAVLPDTIGVSKEGIVMELLTRPVEPVINDTVPAQAQAQALLALPFTLVADDPLTNFGATWPVEPSVVANWLVAQPVVPIEPNESDKDSARLIITVQEENVRAYLEDLGSQLTDDVAIHVNKTVSAVQAAIETGQHQTTVALTHQSHIYTVQPGDTLMLVAHTHGFPVWRLAEANPGIEPGELWPGQQIVIPSVDVLFPLSTITDRRIVVNISEQRLYAYEGNALVYDFVTSTGIDSSPTIPGVFQILSKEEQAYASSWDLWMPHFMGIYRTGPDFTNGFHGLPTLSNGSRLWEGYLGRPVSYGCIVIGLNEAAALFEWAELGTLVMIQE